MNLNIGSSLIEEPMNRLCESVLKMPWESETFYKEYLAQTYHYVFHSCRLLAYAAALTSSSQSSFYTRALKHLSEESGHDDLAKIDLKRLGSSITEYPELSSTRSMWEPQYYKVMKHGSESLMGYILALEYMVIKCYDEVYKRLQSTYSEKSLNFIRVHVDEDPDHVEKAFKTIEPLSLEKKKVIYQSYVQACFSFEKLLFECMEVSKKESYSYKSVEMSL